MLLLLQWQNGRITIGYFNTKKKTLLTSRRAPMVLFYYYYQVRTLGMVSFYVCDCPGRCTIGHGDIGVLSPRYFFLSLSFLPSVSHSLSRPLFLSLFHTQSQTLSYSPLLLAVLTPSSIGTFPPAVDIMSHFSASLVLVPIYIPVIYNSFSVPSFLPLSFSPCIACLPVCTFALSMGLFHPLFSTSYCIIAVLYSSH